MIAPLLANDNFMFKYRRYISYSFETDVLLEYAILMRHVSFHIIVFIFYWVIKIFDTLFVCLNKSCEH